MPFNKVDVLLTCEIMDVPVSDWDKTEIVVLIKPATAPKATRIQ
jgi:hypothetical protein